MKLKQVSFTHSQQNNDTKDEEAVVLLIASASNLYPNTKVPVAILGVEEKCPNRFFNPVELHKENCKF